MLGPGPLIAIDVILLYAVMGPLVLFALYVLFDFLDQFNKDQFDKNKPVSGQGARPGIRADEKDPTLLSDDDIEDLIN